MTLKLTRKWRLMSFQSPLTIHLHLPHHLQSAVGKHFLQDKVLALHLLLQLDQRFSVQHLLITMEVAVKKVMIKEVIKTWKLHPFWWECHKPRWKTAQKVICLSNIHPCTLILHMFHRIMVENHKSQQFCVYHKVIPLSDVSAVLPYLDNQCDFTTRRTEHLLINIFIGAQLDLLHLRNTELPIKNNHLVHPNQFHQIHLIAQDVNSRSHKNVNSQEMIKLVFSCKKRSIKNVIDLVESEVFRFLKNSTTTRQILERQQNERYSVTILSILVSLYLTIFYYVLTSGHTSRLHLLLTLV